MGKTKKTGDLVNVVVTDASNNVTLPKALTIGEQPLLTDDSLKAANTAWVNTKLAGKFNNPTGDTTQYIAGDGSLITFPTVGEAGTLIRQVRNSTGATLTKGTVVYINGATGNKPTVTKAIATGDSTSAQTFGLIQANIANNAVGNVVCVGDIVGLDTSSFAEGVQLYLSSTVAGEYTSVKQLAPNHLVYIGIVTRQHPTLGQIEVKIQNGYELDEIHDVAISSKVNNQFLVYESASDLWKNKSLGTIVGGTSSQFVKGDGSLDSNSYALVSQLHNPVTLGTANGLSLATQVLSLGLASTSANGALSSTDWNTFNAKEPAIAAGTSLQYYRGDKTFQTLNTSVVPEGTNLYYTEARVNANTNVAANTAARHNAVTLGTANGLSLSTQALSLGLASGAANGALSSTDWTTFNSKQNALTLTVTGNNGAATLVGSTLNIPTYTLAGLGGQTALNGTGFVKISGTTISYDNNTYLTTISGITAGGELSGTYPNPTLVNSAVTGKLLSGVNITGGTILATDSILTAFGKLQNQVNGLVGSTIYQGTWNASTNTPALTSSVGTNGHYYIVSVAGTTALNGVNSWSVGDWVIFSGNAWQKVDNTDSVVSVNGFTGAVSLTTSNINEGSNLYFTNARAIASVLNGYVSGTGTISATDTILQAIQKLNGNIGALTTTNVTEGTRLYYTDARARASVSLTVTGNSGASTYNNSTGVLNVPTYTLAGLGGQPLLTNPITGTGTTNFLPKFTGASTLGNSLIFDNGTNVGIGTTSPTYKFDINNVGGSGAAARLYGNDQSNVRLRLENANGRTWELTAGLTGVNNSTFTIYDATAAATRLTIDGSGNVGIGTTSPAARLDVGVGQEVNGYSLSGYPFLKFSAGDVLDYGAFGATWNALRFLTNGLERLRITSTGNVGIGTTSPNRTLEVINSIRISGTFPTLDLGNDFDNQIWANSTNLNIKAGGSERITINKSSGNVGIGTTSPTSKLHVSYTSDTDGLRIENSNRGNSYLLTTAGGSAEFFSLYDLTSSQYLYFSGNTGHSWNTQGSERMRITSTGNVGIGTTAPTGLLHIFGSSAAFRIQNNGTGNMQFGQWDGSTNRIEGGGRDFNFVANGAYNMLFETGFTERMRITSGGNVGIGTTNPVGNAGSTAMQIVGADYPVFTVTSSNQSISARLGVGFGNASVGTITNHTFHILSNNAISTTFLANGNVGIGTTSPSEKLHVVGNGLFSGSVTNLNNLIYSGGSLFLRNPANTFDWALYQDASNNLKVDFNGTTRLTMSSGGEATFSGTVTASNGALVGGDGVSRFWTGTQAQYDAITTKVSTTVYLIT
jgi:hypothetical protein